MSKQVEVCIGCNATAVEHPMVAIVNEGGAFVHKPVCRTCHEDPAHRTTPIKGHFFPRQHRVVAAMAAGSSTITG